MRANPVLPDVLPAEELRSLLGAAEAGALQALADDPAVPEQEDLAAAPAPGAAEPIHDRLSSQEALLDPELWSSSADDDAEPPLVEIGEETVLDPMLLQPPVAADPGAVAHDAALVEWRQLSVDSSLDRGSSGDASGALSDTVLDTADLLDIGTQRLGGPGFHPWHTLASAADAGGDIAPIDGTFDAKGGKPGSGGGGGGGGSTSYFAGSDDGTLGYDIWIEFKGSWTTELQQAFKDAADYFVTVITDDIGGGGLYRGKTIDDLYVTAELKAIDGVGGVLGQAGPNAVWTANDLTAAGTMQFDSADAANYFGLGLWDEIVTHELMHVLGFGSLWNYGSHVGLVTNFQYSGDYALDAYNSAVDPDVSFIPVESDGGSGTAGSHWDEGALDKELMTGYIDGSGNYLSSFSVMSLADLGYQVTYQDYPYDNPVIV